MIYVLSKFGRNPYDGVEIDTTSNSGNYRDLSPFLLGPVRTYLPHTWAQNFENLWQFSKVYSEHVNEDTSIKEEWYRWRGRGWGDTRAHRYPMGKGRTPLFALWDGERLGYIEARKKIYIPIYAEYVVRTESYRLLEEICRSGQNLILRDYDGYDYVAMNKTLREVVNDPNRKMGHAFILVMMLKGGIQSYLIEEE